MIERKKRLRKVTKLASVESAKRGVCPWPSRCKRLLVAVYLAWVAATVPPLVAEEYVLHEFERQQLTDTYYSEGANAGDLDRDGHPDVVYGPHWYKGPDMRTRHELYPAQPQPREAYADNFFCWIYDVDQDGWNDVVVVGFPGTPAYVYRNPGAAEITSHWQKHEVFDWVSNESPQFVNLVGDERPELVCTRDGFFGFATIEADDPLGTWKFHAISDQITATRFGHGLGVGDVNGDGRLDVIYPGGWFEQPESNPGIGRWRLHPAKLSDSYGGAEMYAYDVDGDNDQDIVTSLAAHDFGLAWYEQQAEPGQSADFKQHTIMGDHPSQNHYGVLFTELHSVNLVDLDGDGLKDILTGKTFYSHHQQSPLWDAGAVVYWFRLTRGAQGPHWVPYRLDDVSGIGRQLSVADLNGDGLMDIVVGGMKGAHVLWHRTRQVDREQWEAAQPKPYDGPPAPTAEGAEAKRGEAPPIDETTGSVPDAIEAETLPTLVSAGRTATQAMGGFTGSRWSNDGQLFWTGGRPGDALTLTLPRAIVPEELEIVFTCAADYGIVQLELGGKPFGKPLDLYARGVESSGVLRWEPASDVAASDELTVRIVGRHPAAKPVYFVGIDYVRVHGAEDNAGER